MCSASIFPHHTNIKGCEDLETWQSSSDPCGLLHSTSITSSRPSKHLRAAIAASAPGHTAAIMFMLGVISHVADCFQAGIQLLTTLSATSTQTPPVTFMQTQSHEASFQPPPPLMSSQPPFLPASSQTPPYRLHAAKLITEDAYLDRTIMWYKVVPVICQEQCILSDVG